MQLFLYADDTLLFIPSTPRQVTTTLKALLRLLQKYAEVSGYRLNIEKCGLVCQGADTIPVGTRLFGVKVRDNVKYLSMPTSWINTMVPWLGSWSKRNFWPPSLSGQRKKFRPCTHGRILSYDTLCYDTLQLFSFLLKQ